MQYLSSSGFNSSCVPSTSTRISTSGAAAAPEAPFFGVAVFVCLPGFVFLLLILTAAPPSWLDCVTVPGASLLLRRLAAVLFGEGSTTGVLPTAGVGVRRLDLVGAIDSGSREGTPDRRDPGLEVGAGVDSVFGAIDACLVLDARVVVVGMSAAGSVRFSLIPVGTLIDSGAGVEGGATSAAGGGDFAAAILGFFFLGWPGSEVSTEGDGSGIDTSISSIFLFLEGFGAGFLPVEVPPLVVGELATPRLSDARALENGLNRFLKADPISPSRRAACSASRAACAA